ncbi:trypsin-like serine protease [Actinoplanes sp. NPDC026670]|uniref:S1 family peptidase n=1 Tax=Actinoplanes sp. NPDC026670 TaxID=3154700 RepID=UPI0033C51DFC
MRRRIRSWGSAALVAGLAGSLLSGGTALAMAGAQEVPDGSLPFVAKVSFGDIGSCTGALVHARWIVTAKSCFADGTTAVTAGAPTRPTTVVLGRANLAAVSGHRLSVVSLTPHASRNIVLAELSAPVKNITPVTLDGGAPQEGETLRIAGYGRTSNVWVPTRMHAGDFTVGAVTADSFAVSGATSGATLCKGDAGGPAFRETQAGVQLVGISDTSWQNGCLGESETREGAFEARTDDLADWIRAGVATVPDGLREQVTGEFNRDGIEDLIGADASGNLWLHPGTRTRNAYADRVRIGTGWAGMREFVVGKVNRDAYDDLVVIEASTNIQWLYPGTATGGVFGARVQIGSGWSTDLRDVAIGKVDRDQYDDLLVVKTSTQQLLLYKGNATGGSFSAGVVYGTGWGCCKQLQVGKFNNDDYDDLLTVETSTGAMRIYPGTAAGTQFGPGVDAGAGTGWNYAANLIKGTVDDTGIQGLIGVDATTGRTWLHPRTATAGWAARFPPSGKIYVPQPSDLTNLVTGKFNRDAYTDVIGTDSAGVLWLHPGTAANTFGPRVQIGSGWNVMREFAAGKVNRDAYDDLVVIETSTNIQWLYPGTAAGGVFGARVQIGSGWSTDLRDVAIGKVDRDQYDDLLVVKSSTQQLLLYKGNATGGSFSAGVVYGSGWGCCKEVTLGSVNDDGYDDLLTVVTSTGGVNIYPGTAAGTQFGPGVDAGAGTGWASRTNVTPIVLGQETRAGILAKDSTGALLFFTVRDHKAIDWSDPIRFGPRD